MPNALLSELPIVVKFKIKEDDPVKLKVVSEDAIKFKLDSALIVGEGTPYEGEYIITPLAYDDQILETKGKLLVEDVVVQKVPKYETSNLAGGVTVYIAEV